MAHNVKMLSYNCRGLNNTQYRKKLFLWFQDQNLDIIMLQETFCTSKLETYLKSEWKGQILLGLSDSVHSRGVAILLSENFKGTVLNSYASDDGRVVIANIELFGEIISLSSIYAPTVEAERINFFNNLKNTLMSNSMNTDNIIMAGDFNTCLRNIDRMPDLGRVDRSVTNLNSLLKTCKLNDLWMTHHPQSPGFTYYDKKTRSRSRLDYIMMSDVSLLEVKNIKITEPIKELGIIDHSAVKATFSLKTQPKGGGYWKLNNSILKDEEFQTGLVETIKNTVSTYSDLRSKQLMWEIVKVSVREFSIKYSKVKANSKAKTAENVQDEIDVINNKVMMLETKTH